MTRQENERIEALRRMLTEKEQEVVNLESLERMMEEELSKDDQDIDTDYVDELARMILEYQRCKPVGKAPSARKRQSRHMRGRMVRTASLILVIGMMLAISTANIAGAFSWIDIVKFLSPLMDQLGISVNVSTDEEMNVVKKAEEMKDSEQASDEWGEIVDIVIYDENELPEFIEGYPVKPPYLPEGYVFKRAELYSDGALTDICMTYSTEENDLYIQERVYKQGVGGDIIVAEQKAEEQFLERIDILMDNDVVTAVMNLDTCHYSAWGKESEEVILRIIQEYEGEIFQ